MQRRSHVLLLSLVLTIFAGGCGYHFQGGRSILPEDIKTVYVEPVDNATPEPGLGLRFTEVLRSTFERFGALKVVYERERADSVFDAKIARIDTQARSVTGSTDIELEVDLVMTIVAELRRDTGQLLWRNPMFTVSESFASTSDTVVTSSADFAAGGISADSLAGLDSREVSRGQAQEVLDELLDEAALKLYLSSVAADF